MFLPVFRDAGQNGIEKGGSVMKKKSCFILLTVMLMMMLAAIPVSAKTVIVPGIVIDQAKGEKEWHYGMNSGLYGKAKWKSGTYSAELLVPADLFVKNNAFSIEGQVDLSDASIKGDSYMGTATSNSIIIMINKNGKISIKRWSVKKDKWVQMGSASAKAEKVSSGKYYLVTIKNMPFDNTYYPKDSNWEPRDAETIPTNKYMNYAAKFDINSWGTKLNKAVKDCIYLISFSCNTGTKTLKLNFTGNFQWFDAWGGIGNDEIAVTKKIARVSY